MMTLLSIPSCGPDGPEPIKLNTDNCDFCKMTIVDGRFGTELITKKGRVYKFDDLSCMAGYVKENPKAEALEFYIHNYKSAGELIDAKLATYLSSDSLRSPMGGNIAAFLKKEEAENIARTLNVKTQTWDQVKPQ